MGQCDDWAISILLKHTPNNAARSEWEDRVQY